MSDEVDVVVAGAGAAGLSAALTAAGAGATAALLEWKEHFRHGNNTSMSTSMIPAAGSRWQREQGIDDSPERFLEDVLRKTKGAADPTVARALVDVAPDLVAWLADVVGVPLGLVTDFVYPGHSRPRCHSVPDRAGATLLGHLLEAVDAAPGCDLIVQMRIVDVELDEEGAVEAAIVEDPSGHRERIPTGAVVFATGGFGASKALVAEHVPEIADGLYFGGDGCAGDALRIGEELGVDMGCLDAYQGHGSVAIQHNVLVTWATVMHGAILVNRDGKRFGDETIGYSEYARMVLDQPDSVAWIILDDRIDQSCRSFKDYQDLRSQDGVHCAGRVDAIAREAGVDYEGLARTLEEVREYASDSAVDPHQRTDWEAPLEQPLLWVKVTGALFHTQGGVRVDGHARVRRGREPVTGLYAAGGAAVGMSGHGANGYLAGNGLLAALGLGHLAGRDVASGRA